MSEKTTVPLYTVALYIRVSTEEQAKDGYSLAAQEEILKMYCKEKQYNIYKIYSDEGISAKDTNRPKFKAMISDALQNKFNAILVWKLTRLTRSLGDLTHLCKELFTKSIAIISYTENFDCTTPSGRLLLNILATTAEFERENITENVKMGLRERAKEGYACCVPTLGYNHIGKNMLEVDIKEAEQVKFIFKKFLQVQAISEVCRICDQKGYLGKNGKKQSPQQIALILTRPLYTGYFLFKGNIYKGTHKPIISVSTYNKVQKILEERSRKFGKNRKVIYIKN